MCDANALMRGGLIGMIILHRMATMTAPPLAPHPRIPIPPHHSHSPPSYSPLPPHLTHRTPPFSLSPAAPGNQSAPGAGPAPAMAPMSNASVEDLLKLLPGSGQAPAAGADQTQGAAQAPTQEAPPKIAAASGPASP